MTEASSSPPPLLTSPDRISPWLIVVLVIVMACCLCIGLCGLLGAFGPDILHELGLMAWLPLLRLLA
jgi:hypothetical protein